MSSLTDSQLKDLAQAQTMGGPQPGDVYLHYKGGRYTIVARSLMEDTLTPLVTYQSQLKGTYWTRTESNFSETVEANDGSGPVPRFRRIGQ